jgi:hypothetical protein
LMESPHVKRAFADPAIQAALMQHMQAQAAAAAPPAPPAPVGMAEGGALHFDAGGVSTSTVVEMQQLTQQIATMPEGPQKDQARMRLATLQAQSSGMGLTFLGGSASAAPGASSSSLRGLSNQMVGPPTVGNTALATGVGALMGAGNTANPGKGALLGAGLAGGLSYLIRKYGKNAQQQANSGSRQKGSGSLSTDEEPNLSQPAGTSTATPASAPSVTLPSPTPSGSTPTGPPQLMMGSASTGSGTVFSRDGGKTWIDSQDDSKDPKPYDGKVVNPTPISPGSSLIGASPVTTPPTQSAPNVDLINPPWSPPAPSPSLGTGSGLVGAGDENEDALAKGGPVPAHGLGAVLPVLHIMIAAKPKETEKKASLVPPKRGPQDHEDRPRAHGRVQVPRGSGAAIKGKRFGGIY